MKHPEKNFKSNSFSQISPSPLSSLVVTLNGQTPLFSLDSPKSDAEDSPKQFINTISWSPLKRGHSFDYALLPFSVVNKRRTEAYGRYELFEKETQLLIMDDHLTREAMRRHVESEKSERPERERREQRQTLWLSIINLASRLSHFSHSAKKLNARYMLQKLFSPIWYRRHTVEKQRKVRMRKSNEMLESMAKLTTAQLSQQKFFGLIPPKMLAMIIEVLQPEAFEPGDFIMRQGDPVMTGMYVLDSGEAEVLIQKKDGTFRNKKRRGKEQSISVFVLKAGMVFGEVALLSEEPRAASIRCLTECTTWMLPKIEFRNKIMSQPDVCSVLTQISDDRRKTNMTGMMVLKPANLKSISMFAGWREDQLADFIARMKPCVTHMGELLMKTGDPSDSMYYISRGKMEIFTELPDGGKKIVTSLQSGEIVGEIGCIFLESRSFSVASVTDCDLWFISLQDFRDFLMGNAVCFLGAKEATNIKRAQWIAPLPQKHLPNSKFFNTRYTEKIKRVTTEAYQQMVPRVFGRTECITERNAPCREIIFILSGTVQGVTTGVTFSEGSCFGGEEIVEGRSWNDSFRALTRVDTWVLPGVAVKKLLTKFPAGFDRKRHNRQLGHVDSKVDSKISKAKSPTSKVPRTKTPEPEPEIYKPVIQESVVPHHRLSGKDSLAKEMKEKEMDMVAANRFLKKKQEMLQKMENLEFS